MEINFHIPDFTNHLYLNTILINSISKYPEYFQMLGNYSFEISRILGDAYKG